MFKGRKRKRIQRLKTNEDEWREGQQEVTQVILDHVVEIFASSDPQGIEKCIRAIPTKGDDRMNDDLSRLVTNDEIKKAAFSLRALKVPGSDGLNGLFFQNH